MRAALGESSSGETTGVWCIVRAVLKSFVNSLGRGFGYTIHGADPGAWAS